MKQRPSLALLAAAILLFAVAPAQAATNITGKIILWPNITHTMTQGASTASETFANIVQTSTSFGTNAAQMTGIALVSATLTNGASATFSLRGGISNSFGRALTFARVSFLAVHSSTNNAHPITVGGAASEPFASWAGGTNPTVTVRPGGAWLSYAPDAVGFSVETNAHNLKIANTGTNSVSFDAYVGGVVE